MSYSHTQLLRRRFTHRWRGALTLRQAPRGVHLREAVSAFPSRRGMPGAAPGTPRGRAARARSRWGCTPERRRCSDPRGVRSPRVPSHAEHDPVPDRAQNPAAQVRTVRHAQVELVAIARNTLADAKPWVPLRLAQHQALLGLDPEVDLRNSVRGRLLRVRDPSPEPDHRSIGQGSPSSVKRLRTNSRRRGAGPWMSGPNTLQVSASSLFRDCRSQ